MRAFDYVSPTALAETLELLEPDGESGAGGSRPLAGGTDLLPMLKLDLVQPARLVSLRRVQELGDRIEASEQGLELGARTPLAAIERDPIVLQRYTALADAVASAATPQLRNMATIAGNLLQRPRCWYFRDPNLACWLKGGDDCPAYEGENQQHALFGGGPCYAVHPSDPAAALVALSAEARLRGPTGERVLPLASFFALPTEKRRTETVVRPDEVLVSVRVPAPAQGARSTYLKAMDRKVWSFALVGVAAVLRLDGGRITEARLVLSGVAPIPWRLEAAERVLVGGQPEANLFERAAAAGLSDAHPLQHNAYKLPLARALIKQALERAAGPLSLAPRTG